MTLLPLLQAPLAVQVHVVAIFPAVPLGLWLLLATKGTTLHRNLGKLWVGLMATGALSSFFIREINVVAGFSPIHILSIITLYSLWHVVAHARAGRIQAHLQHVRGLFFMALIGAGAFTLLPGRRMNAVLFGTLSETTNPAWLLLAAGAGLAVALWGLRFTWRRAAQLTVR